MESCWICFQEEGELIRPCQCPRAVHRQCLASWQLYSAGTREEAECRFCSHKLPNWKAALRPKCTVTAPVVAVVYEGQEYRFRVEPTPEGQGRFMKEVEAMLGHPLGLHEVKFYCRAPTGTNLQLQGLESLDAAVYCAAATAAERAAQLEVLLSAVAATQDVQTRSSAVDAVDATSSSLGTEASSSNAGTVQSQVEHSNDNAAEYQQPTPPGLDMLQYWRAMRAMGVPLASSTSSNIEDGPHEQRLYRRPTMHGSTAPFAMGVSAAQRLSEMAAAWAYLSSDGSDMADATARVQVQRPIATRQPAEPVLVLGEASPAAGDYPVANTSGAGHDQAVIQRHHSATNQGSPHSSLVTATGPVSDDVAPPATGSCISNWVATLVRSALECLAARTAESRRAMTATAD